LCKKKKFKEVKPVKTGFPYAESVLLADSSCPHEQPVRCAVERRNRNTMCIHGDGVVKVLLERLRTSRPKSPVMKKSEIVVANRYSPRVILVIMPQALGD